MTWLYFPILCLFMTLSVGEVKRPRGVPLSKASMYNSHSNVAKEEFTCFDGSAVISIEAINDDYCDCSDGSDEPGTAACPGNSFHCSNAGYKPKYIPSSRVNDGICDCCDGTDEYSGQVTCANYCKEMGKQYREEQDQLQKLQLEGHQIYKEYCQDGSDTKAERKLRIETAKTEKEELESDRETLEVAKNEAEAPEKEAKKKHEEAWEVEKAMTKAVEENQKITAAFAELDADDNQMVSVEEMQNRKEFDIDSNGEVSVEEAKEYLEENDEVNEETFFEKVWPHIKDLYKIPGEEKEEEEEDAEEKTEEPQHAGGEEEEEEEEEDGHEEDEDDIRPDPEMYDVDDEDYYEDQDQDDDGDEDDDEDYRSKGNTDKGVKENMPEHDPETKALIEAANIARQAYQEVDRKYKDLDKEITDLEKELNLDFGPNNEFYPLKGKCYEFSDREYTYKFCPYEKCTQRNKNGGQETSLGNWGHWAGQGSGDELYTAMKYEKGQNCWNGPDRSVKVIIKCGVDNELLSSSEPNRCEYEYTFRSPAACSNYPSPEQKQPDHDEL